MKPHAIRHTHPPLPKRHVTSTDDDDDGDGGMMAEESRPHWAASWMSSLIPFSPLMKLRLPHSSCRIFIFYFAVLHSASALGDKMLRQMDGCGKALCNFTLGHLVAALHFCLFGGKESKIRFVFWIRSSPPHSRSTQCALIYAAPCNKGLFVGWFTFSSMFVLN